MFGVGCCPHALTPLVLLVLSMPNLTTTPCVPAHAVRNGAHLHGHLLRVGGPDEGLGSHFQSVEKYAAGHRGALIRASCASTSRTSECFKPCARALGQARPAEGAQPVDHPRVRAARRRASWPHANSYVVAFQIFLSLGPFFFGGLPGHCEFAHLRSRRDRAARARAAAARGAASELESKTKRKLLPYN
eukprot:COSAG06_NODE_3164_length_5749_cov_16.498407_3_plen_189_part_00